MQIAVPRLRFVLSRAARGRLALVLAALILVALPLAGCGKKPGGVTAPQGEEEDRFPRTYPSE